MAGPSGRRPRPGPGRPSPGQAAAESADRRLGALCREIGEVEHSYFESFRTFSQDFDFRQPDLRVDTSVDALRAWSSNLDRELMTALEAMTEPDMSSRRIMRADFDEDYFSPLPTEQLDVYREACSSSTAKPVCT